jgi:hypothetical protein
MTTTTLSGVSSSSVSFVPRNLILILDDGSLVPIPPHRPGLDILGVNQESLAIFLARRALPQPDPDLDIDPRLSLTCVIPPEQLHLDEPFDPSARFTLPSLSVV